MTADEFVSDDLDAPVPLSVEELRAQLDVLGWGYRTAGAQAPTHVAERISTPKHEQASATTDGLLFAVREAEDRIVIREREEAAARLPDEPDELEDRRYSIVRE